MLAVFLTGDSGQILKGLPPNFFHCAVTSPPYYGLRKYDGGVEIWDGDENCQHEWVSYGATLLHENRQGLDGSSIGNTERRQGKHGYKIGEAAFCSKCGAWRGQLGSESTPDDYIRHLIQIMREVRRVLRPDGVFWLNIGDSWSGGSRKTSLSQSSS